MSQRGAIGRQFVRASLLLALLATSGCASAGSTARMNLPTTSDRFFVAGYHPYWAGDAWSSYPTDVLDELFFFEVEVGADGSIFDAHGWPAEWDAMVADALSAGVQVVPTISMHDAEAFSVLFSDASRVKRLVTTILGVLGAPAGSPGAARSDVSGDLPSSALSGIHLDFEVFEPVELDVRDGFTAFVALLAQRMDAYDPSLSLSVFTLAFDDDDVYNEKALGQLADYLVVQGYDFYSASSDRAGPVGAVAGWGRLNWSTVVDRFEDFGVPARKIVMGVPLYGYEWPVTSGEMGAETRGEGRTIPYMAGPDVLPDTPRASDRAREHGIHRDTESGSPYYAFQGSDGWYQGWFDDVESLQAKYDFVRARGLGGIAMFPLAYGDASVWEGLRRAFFAPR